MSGTLDQEVILVPGVKSGDIMVKASIKNEVEEAVKKPSLTHLYLARTLAAWGDRTWQFVGGLFMIRLGEHHHNSLQGEDEGEEESDSSLQLVGIFGLVSCLSVLVSGSAIGRMVDNTARNRLVTMAILIQNISIILACGIMAVHFSGVDGLDEEHHDPFVIAAISASVIAFFTLSYLASMAARISVEKDWIVCLCEDDPIRLSVTNTNVRTIDLVCNLTAPFLAGLALNQFPYHIAAIVLIFWILVSTTLELLLLNNLYDKNDSLKDKVFSNSGQEGGPCTEVVEVFRGWSVYCHHHVREAGLALAMLYMTVLGFDAITWGYCKQQGVTEATLGALTGVSALVGVAGARLYPVLLRKLTLTTTGLLGFSLQTLCLTLCLVSVWAPGSPFSLTAWDSVSLNTSLTIHDDNISHLQPAGHDEIVPNIIPVNMNSLNTTFKDVTPDSSSSHGSLISVILLLIGIISSRAGLYIADLTVHQIFQQELEESQRGIVSGVQTGLQSFMDLVKFGLVIALPHPDKFGFLIILSFLFVMGGGFSFLRYKLKIKPLDRAESDSLLSNSN